MNIEQVKKLIQQLLLTISKNKIYNHLKKNYPNEFDFIEKYYNWPSETLSSTKIYWILNGIHELPKCIVCGKQIKINQISRRTGKYRLHCSHYCGCHSQHSREEYKKTCLKKYGAEHNMKSKKGLDEYSASIQEKYGKKFITQVQSIKNKISKTNLNKYNSISPFGSQKIQEKIKKTCLKKYGVEYGFIQDKVIEQNKIDSITRSYNNILLKDEYDKPLFSLNDYLNRKNDLQIFKFRCKKCGEIFESRHHDGFHLHCQKCFPIDHKNEQQKIFNFLNETSFQCQNNIRTIISPQEIDIYIPDKKLGIEYDGLYWHSENQGTKKNYHNLKTIECEKQGIQLIHIFENEWLLKQNIVKSRLKNLLGIYDRVVFARKCYIKEVDSKISKEFQDKNHIQGAVNAKINLGLFYEEKLVALMTFGKSRFNKQYEWELLRFCTELGYHIPGGASKLLKYFERNYKPKSLISYADRRWSQGKLYKALGFQLDHISGPDYWYFKKNDPLILYHRSKFQKHKLSKILDIYDQNLTEYQNMCNNNYFRIFDCGNYVFVKKFLD